MKMYKVQALARTEASGKFTQIEIERNTVGPDDVQIELKYCGVCHSDIHMTENHMGNTKYPCVPGHELAGVVTKVGCKVKKLKVGDQAGVGCICDSCQKCDSCKAGEEHICEKRMTMTYGDDTTHGHIKTNLGYSLGGYSTGITIHQRYAVVIPKAYPLIKAGPVFCAGLTMYSPLKHWGAIKGKKTVGIIGIGGLGQMGVRLAKAMGCEVTAISTSTNKEAVAKSIGAKHFVVSSSPESMAAAADSLDLILNTVSANHQVAHYLPLLRRDGTIVQLGFVPEDHQVNQLMVMMKRVSISGSVIGGMVDTQEVINFCHKHKIEPEIEMVEDTAKLDEVYVKLNSKNDSIKRYVIDIKKAIK